MVDGARWAVWGANRKAFICECSVRCVCVCVQAWIVKSRWNTHSQTWQLLHTIALVSVYDSGSTARRETNSSKQWKAKPPGIVIHRNNKRRKSGDTQFQWQSTEIFILFFFLFIQCLFVAFYRTKILLKYVRNPSEQIHIRWARFSFREFKYLSIIFCFACCGFHSFMFAYDFMIDDGIS